jgi:hypothetical protein
MTHLRIRSLWGTEDIGGGVSRRTCVPVSAVSASSYSAYAFS